MRLAQCITCNNLIGALEVECFDEDGLINEYDQAHDIWVQCGRPHNGKVADIMRRTRSK